jgi:hypothetical protein
MKIPPKYPGEKNYQPDRMITGPHGRFRYFQTDSKINRTFKSLPKCRTIRTLQDIFKEIKKIP